MPGSVSVNILPLPVAYTVSGGGNYCAGGTGVHVYLNATNIGINYQLYNGTSAIGIPVAGTSGAIDFGLQTATGTYTVVATNASTSCINIMSGSAVVSASPLPAVFTVTGGGGYCAGGTGVHVGLNSSSPGIIYQLFSGGVSAGAALSGTGSALDFGIVTAAGAYTVAATNTVTGCTNNMTGAVTVAVNPLPIAFAVTGGGNYCSGGTGVHVGLSSSTAGVNYQLYRGTTMVGSLVGGTNFALDFGLQTIAGTYTVVATNASTGCTNNMMGSATVATNSLPTIFSITGGGGYCAGGTGMLVGLSGSSAGTTYLLYIGGSTLTGAGSGTGGAIDFGLKTLAGSYTAVATDIATGCSANMSGSVSIAINPLPVSTYTVTGGGNYCAGGTGVVIGLSNSQTGISYQLFAGGTATGVGVAGTGSVISFGLNTAAGTYTVVGTNTTTTCANNMTGSTVIGINPLPVMYSVSGGGPYCAGSTGVHISLSGSDAGIRYQLFNGTLATGLPVPGSGTAIDFGMYTLAGTYTLVGTNNTTSCANAMGGTAVVSINSLPTVFAVTGGGNYCSGGTGVHVYLDNSTAGISYQLYEGTTPSGPAEAGTGAAIDFGLKTTAGNYTVVASIAATGCTNNMSGIATISVNALPVLHSVTGGGGYCAGGSGRHIGLNTSSTGIAYQLFNGTTPAAPAVTGTGGAIDFGLHTAGGVYTVVATDPGSACIRNMTGSATITVNPLPGLFAVTGGGNYCIGGTGVHIGLSGSATGTSYQLFRGSTLIGPALTGTGSSVDFGIHATPGTYTLLATNTATGCTQAMSGSAIVVVSSLPAPHLVTGGGSYCAGGTGVHVGLDGSNTAVNYQLYLGTSATGSPVPGTGGTIDFGVFTTAGAYQVIATSPVTGCTANMIGTATVAIDPLPVVFGITGGGNYCAGGTGVHIGLNGSHSFINYQLYSGTTAVGSALAGTGLPLDFGLYTGAGTYTITASNTGTGCSNNMIGSTTVGINPLPALYSVSGGGTYCPGGSGLHINLSGSDGGTSYQLYNGSSLTGTAIPGSGAAIDFGLQTMTGMYTVAATNTVSGCSSNMAGSTTIATYPALNIYAMTGGGNYCAGSTGVDIGLSKGDAGINYQLYNGTAMVGTAVVGSGTSLDLGIQTIPGIYTVVGTEPASGCNQNMTGSANISVNPLPVIFTVTGGGVYCAGSGGSAIGLAGSEPGIAYQLYNGTTATGGPVTGSGFGIDFVLVTASGNYTVSATNMTTGCVNNMTGSATVSVNPTPTMYAVTGGGYICAGGTGVHIGLNGSETGTNYQMYRSGVASGSVLPGTGAALDFGIQVAPGSYTIAATNTATGCTGNMAGPATISVNPLPLSYSVTGGGGYCSGGTGVHIGLNGSAPGISYQLYAGTSSAGSPVPGTGSPIDFGLQTIAAVYTVVATNTASGCTNNMTGSTSVAANLLPAIYAVTGGGNYCAGSAGVDIGLSGSMHDVSYQLYRGTTPVGSATAGSGSPIDFGLQTTTGTYTVIATNTLTSCNNPMAGSATVLISPLPDAYPITGGGSYCAGGAGVHVGVCTSATGMSYQLFNGTSPVGPPLAGTGSGLDFGLLSAAGTYMVLASNTTTSCARYMTGGAAININPLPVAYSITGGGSYCAGATGVHVGLGNSTAGIRYQLYNGFTAVGSAIPGTGSAIDFGPETVAGSYRVIGTNIASACSNDMAGSTTVSINPVVSTSVNIGTTAGDTLCEGNLTAFTSVPVNGGSTPTYRWTVNGVVRGTAASFAYVPADGDILSVNMISSIVCASPHGASGTRTLRVEANETPIVTVAANPGATVCKGTLVNFSATAYFGGRSPAYTWVRNDTVSGTGAGYSYVPADGDVVYCVMASNYHCRLSNSGSSPLINMHVSEPVSPLVQITAHPGLSIAAGQTERLVATVTYGGPTPGFQWLINGTPAPGATTATFVTNGLVDGDVVSCDVTSSGACAGLMGGKSVTIHVYGVGVSQVTASTADIQLVPNPNKGIFTIKGATGTSDKELSVEITDLVGHVVYKDDIPVNKGDIDQRIQLSQNIPNGMYLLILKSSAGQKVFHIVVEQ